MMMKNTQLLLSLTFNFLFFAGGHAATIYFTNNCPYMVWPGTLTSDQKPELPTTGFELAPKASNWVDTPTPWKGCFWARTDCSTDVSGKFTCATADCDSGKVTCDGKGAIPPATLVEIKIPGGGSQDFYDVSLVDGFNLPVSVTPQGGNGNCRASMCPANVNAACPEKLQVKGDSGSVIACKSACVAFNDAKYCCTGAYSKPETCPPSNYSSMFHDQCPQAYSYAHDDLVGTFTCSGSPNYAVTFCP